MRDELGDEIARQRLVVVKAVVGALRTSPGVVRRLQQHQRVTSAVRRQHDRKKLARTTNGPSGFSFSDMPGFSPDHSTVPAKTTGSATTFLPVWWNPG